MAILDIHNISINFGGLKAVTDFTLSLEKGEIVAIIGPNGAGKTTVFNMLTGIYKPTTGKIILDGEDMTGQKPYVYTQHGIARTFQNIRLFSNASVLDNLLIAQTFHTKYSMFTALSRNKSFYKIEKELAKKAMEMLGIFHLADKADYVAKNLPYGEQRRLEIARALMTNPKVLLLDEPCAGMVSSEIDDVIKLIGEVRNRFGVTILLIEHHMSLVMSIAERIKVINFGQTIAEGLPYDIQRNPAVISAYLGGEFVNA